MPAPTPVMVPYSQLRPTLKTGDILSFSGTSPLDWMIRVAEGGPYTHVGMVLEYDGQLCFWDAPGGEDKLSDPMTGKAHAGARIAVLDDLLKYYMSVEVAMYARQLKAPISAQQQAALGIFLTLADGVPFPGTDLHIPGVNIPIPPGFQLGAGLFLSGYIGKEWSATIAGNFFCAHLVAETYMRMGMMPIYPKPANAFSPEDFNATSASVLSLIGCSLTPTVQVKYP